MEFEVQTPIDGTAGVFNRTESEVIKALHELLDTSLLHGTAGTTKTSTLRPASNLQAANGVQNLGLAANGVQNAGLVANPQILVQPNAQPVPQAIVQPVPQAIVQPALQNAQPVPQANVQPIPNTQVQAHPTWIRRKSNGHWFWILLDSIFGAENPAANMTATPVAAVPVSVNALPVAPLSTPSPNATSTHSMEHNVTQTVIQNVTQTVMQTVTLVETHNVVLQAPAQTPATVTQQIVMVSLVPTTQLVATTVMSTTTITTGFPASTVTSVVPVRIIRVVPVTLEVTRTIPIQERITVTNEVISVGFVPTTIRESSAVTQTVVSVEVRPTTIVETTTVFSSGTVTRQETVTSVRTETVTKQEFLFQTVVQTVTISPSITQTASFSPSPSV